jgi:nucleoside-diphosphate-sugar epimerase
MVIMVTGANGFVGRLLCDLLRRRGDRVIAAVRNSGSAPPFASAEYVAGNLTSLPDLQSGMRGIDCVVHLAGRAHIMRENNPDSEQEFLRSNALVTHHLATQAAAAGVRRLVFLSSIKVNGEVTTDRPFRESDPPTPLDAYGRSKLAAENALRKISAETGLEAVVIRPPLIYGPGVKANFRILMHAVAKGYPLPLASVNNRRSLVSLWNLCDLISICTDHAGAAGETFLVADEDDLSTPELCRELGKSLQKPARLFPVSICLLKFAGRLLARCDMVERLIGSLQVDWSKTNRILGWYPPLSSENGLARTTRWYLDSIKTGNWG